LEEKWAKTLGETIFKDIQSIFPAKQVVIAPAVEERIEQKKEISVLDSKRAYNINIMLGRLKVSFGDIRRAILQLDFNVMTRQLITQFLKYVPTAEEIGQLSQYKDNPSELTRADRFLVEMLKVDRYEHRLKAMDFYVRFEERLADAKGDVVAVSRASDTLSQSESLRDLLELILTLGNFMNTGFRGNAYGFRINSINKLIDTKSADNKRTLLHYLVEIVTQKAIKLLKVTDDLQDMTAACRVSFEALGTELNQLTSGLRDIDNELDRFSKDDNQDDKQDRFYSVMSKFSIQANAQLDELRELNKSMRQSFDKVVEKYGEDPSKMGAEEFFGIFKTFGTSFEKVHKEIVTKQEIQARLDRRKRASLVSPNMTSPNEKAVTPLLKNTERKQIPRERSPNSIENNLSRPKERLGRRKAEGKFPLCPFLTTNICGFAALLYPLFSIINPTCSMIIRRR
jgi:hypothetical protein